MRVPCFLWVQFSSLRFAVDEFQVKTNKRYASNEGYTISEVAANVKADIGNLDVVVS